MLLNRTRFNSYDDPNNPAKTLSQLGVSDTPRMPKPLQLVFAQLAFASSRPYRSGQPPVHWEKLLRQHLASQSGESQVLTSTGVGRAGRRVSLQRPALCMSVEMPNGQLRSQGFPARPPPSAGQRTDAGSAKDVPRGKDFRYLH